MNVRITVRGSERLAAALKQRGQALERVLAPALHAALLPVQNSAKRLAPVKTGNLRRNITSAIVSSTSTSVTGMVGVQKGAPYGRRIELGFSGTDSLGRVYHQPARPYLRPAVDENKGTVADILARQIGRLLAQQ